eukprot:gene9210-19102_t
MDGQSLPVGQYTSTIYGAIRENRYMDAIDILQIELQNFPRSRAALSLLGYCFYRVGDFQGSVQVYEQLLQICPDVDEYKLYYAQSLFKGGMYAEATRAAIRVGGEQLAQKKLLLQAIIKYEQDELLLCKGLLDQCLQDDPDILINNAAVAFKEGKYESARNQYTEAINSLGYQADLAYNIALCYFREKQYGPALRHIAEIIEKGVRNHPELSVGSNTDGIEVRSVGNSVVLKETCLIEAFNLKAAIEYDMKTTEPAKVGQDNSAAKEALTDMPPRMESELDPVTLHNQAIIHADEDPTAAFKKLSYLISNPPYPPETFGNLLLLHVKYSNYDTAAGILAENSSLSRRNNSNSGNSRIQWNKSSNFGTWLDAQKFDDLSAKFIDSLRKLTKQIQ